ncbi:transcriptional regulator family: Fungal Specific TF [Penicillium roqueforti]|uniref:transcriptional regulator family: Fungal Specific TF n=1 Tax=Penicillium roqueforti TaxID=5082 RepID=UPI00190AD6C3|nr:transcriptional regulator family: Fungal Specific TF [Penicillium roqueforti]KAF9249836.1 transcriptional regulator family: Fungal Specific TF [Penicillium roqueforti]KAI1830459.1 transcriptional regulator family: Fungal Specific TF [Penicillium roqueforti]KAI3207170.1 transcriptional regulator family: Fungal Specific TF [Penicillium roqueforti]
MSLPSPKKKNGGIPSVPRQIRFVATDGQPQTKRRRVNAACLTCRRRKIRCSGEQPVCKTCSDYKHTCLGYTESTAHRRTQSDSASRAPPISAPNELSQPAARAVESSSPEPVSTTIAKPSADKPNAKPPGSKEVYSWDTSANKDLDTQAVGDSPASGRTSVSSGGRTHVPYFRYFGPTAIVPGFKQMVVQVRGSRKSNPSTSSESLSPLRSPKLSDIHTKPLATAADNRDSRDANIPFYDRDDALPVSNIVSHLCELFFAHLGCSFPFLQRERFLQDLKEKKVDTMLVDAVCSLAARFSIHPSLDPPQAPPIDRSQPPLDDKKWDRGLPFGHRAMSGLVDSLPCPTLSAVQACLLLAYEQFGSNHDSGLWMYLGISIRMAQDLGLQKLQGLKHNYGKTGVTPSEVMTGHAGKLREEQYDDLDVHLTPKTTSQTLVEERARERERVDSFWSIFFLDRVISSGTGRPVTLRDEDIELCFPLQSESQLPNGWPAPFPPLIRIIHLYGRVTDLINGIQDVNLVTPDTLKMLAGMESDLTGIYQHLSPRLHFNAANFQAYVKAKEGTNFILLHFWFHTLIVLLHQPTLLNSFGGSIQHLYPNSRELSMSSAKTIADILSFSELVDGKSFIGNPFTSQPMYIAACAFLMESAYYASSSSGAESQQPQPLLANQSSGFVMPAIESSNGTERKSMAKHILLASAAKENYQRCYKALKALNTYWEGTGYILTVLDQKAKGIVDPLLYAVEEMEITQGIAPGQPPGPGAWCAGNAPTDSVFDPERPAGVADISSDGKWSPHIDPSQAIGWALTGATNSSQPNLSLLYQMSTTEAESSPNTPTYSSQYSHSYPVLPTNAGEGPSSSYAQSIAPARTHEEMTPSLKTNAKYPNVHARTTSTDASYYMGMNSTYPESNMRTTRPVQTTQSTFPGMLPPGLPTSHMDTQPSAYNYSIPQATSDLQPGMDDANGMMIGSHEVDMNSINQQDSLPFVNGEILPWLEYLPQDVLSFFGDHQNYPLMSPDDVSRPP